MAILNFDEKIHKLGIEEIDSVHLEFVDLLNRCSEKDGEEFKQSFLLLKEHTKRHFRNEEELMEQYGVASKKEHKDEHDKVLAEMDYFNNKVQEGKYFFGKSYIKERLPFWFTQHAQTMDSDLANTIKVPT